MAKQTINQGTAPTGAGGDTFRSGSAKLQANDDEIYAQLGATAQGVLPAALPVNKGGTGATTAEAARTNLGLGTAATLNATTSAADKTFGRLMRVSDFGIGIHYQHTGSVNGVTTGLPLSQLRGKASTIFVAENSTKNTWDAGDYPDPIKPTFVSHFNVMGEVPEKEHCVQLAYTNSGHAYIRAAPYDQGFSEWYQLRSTKNSTVDSNGFIKAASPIVELYADHIELNEEAKQQDITFEKLGIGDYIIKGSTGFAQEGWYVETPKDANGNLLVAVVYEQLENGDISVKTYDYMLNKKGRIVADIETPLDIPENRWIDLRLQELPQPEIEESESVAPPEFQPTGLTEAVATVMESYHDPEQ